MGFFQALVQDVPDSETRKWCGPAVLENPHFGSQVKVQLQYTDGAEVVLSEARWDTSAVFCLFP